MEQITVNQLEQVISFETAINFCAFLIFNKNLNIHHNNNAPSFSQKYSDAVGKLIKGLEKSSKS